MRPPRASASLPLATVLAGLLTLAACVGAPGPPGGDAAAGAPRVLRQPPDRALTVALVTEADVPAAFALGPGGRLFVGELTTGRILVDGRVVADLTVSAGDESGLESLAVGPGGDWLLAYASLGAGPDDGGEAVTTQVLRFDLDAEGRPGPPRPILELPGTGTHNAGSVAVGPDGLVYVDVGDNIRRGAAADLSSPFGKILRLTPDGAPAPGNPFADRAGADPRVWAWGIRNSFALTWAADGRLLAADNGPEAGDELNVVEAGANYGWPPEDQPPDARPPRFTWPETFAPAGLAIVPEGFGAWSGGGRVLACGVVAQRMDLVDLDDPAAGAEPVVDGCALHVVAEGPGSVLFSDARAVWRLSAEAR